jgi:hypothetical protein
MAPQELAGGDCQRYSCTVYNVHALTHTIVVFVVALEDAESTERNCKLVLPKVFVVYHRITILTFTVNDNASSYAIESGC